MRRSYPQGSSGTRATWIDLVDPTDAERLEVERETGLRVPDQTAIREIETTSRVYTENGAMYLSTPIPATLNASQPLSAVGFVLTQQVLITVRFVSHPVFDALLGASLDTHPAPAGEVFLRLIEALVDRAADTLEHCSTELDKLSHRAFHSDGKKPLRVTKSASEALRTTLRKLGQMSDSISQIRDTLLGFGRIAAFVCETGKAVFAGDEHARLQAVRADVNSLNDYQQHLSGKVQFLLDATLGFISIEQNEIVKALTIVSVVGVPPVLIAGIYGMNFQYMPELHWRLGYPYALLLMLITGLLPLGWFKWRGWM